MKWWKPLVVAGMAFALLPGCSSDSKSKNSSNNESNVTLTGSMSYQDRQNQQSNSQATQKSAKKTAQATTIDYSLYQLYCVTFTNPPNSGTGSFDATGAFSVTIQNAAGLSVGCFITEVATNKAVATVTFDTGTTSAMGGGGDGSVALNGGSFNITILFDPVTGSAYADVSALVAAGNVAGGGAAAFNVDDMAGTWTLKCPAGDPNCQFDQGVYEINAYFDILTGTDTANNNATVHGFGIWKDKTAFTNCGGTEMIGGQNITGLTGTANPGADMGKPFTGFYNDLLPLAASTAADPTGTGFFEGAVDIITGWDYSNPTSPVPTTGTVNVLKAQAAAITPIDLYAWEKNLAAPYSYPASEWLQPWAQANSTNPWDYCPGATSGGTYSVQSNAAFANGIDGYLATPGNAAMPDLHVRNCIVNYLQILGEKGVDNGAGGTTTLACAPRTDGLWNSRAMQWTDPNSGAPLYDGNDPVLLRNPNEKPDIRDRMDLMPLKVDGSTAVAFNRWYNEWTQWQPDPNNAGSNLPVLCKEGSEMQIVFIPDATVTTAVGKIVQNSFRQCGSDPMQQQYSAFDIDMTKVSGP